jgi:hypothetical protein
MKPLLKEAWEHEYASVKEYVACLESLEKEPPGGTNYASFADEPDEGEREQNPRAVFPSDMEPEFGI